MSLCYKGIPEEMTSFVFLWQSKVIPSQKADLSWLSPRSGGKGRSDVQPGQFFVSHRFSTVQVDGSYRAGLMQYLDLSDRGYYPDAEQTGSFSRHLLPRADLFDSVKKFGPVRYLDEKREFSSSVLPVCPIFPTGQRQGDRSFPDSLLDCSLCLLMLFFCEISFLYIVFFQPVYYGCWFHNL